MPFIMTKTAERDILMISLSCHLCGKTIDDLYHGLDQTDGLRDGTKGDQGVINMLWLTECDHVFCRDHLPGGECSMEQRQISLSA